VRMGRARVRRNRPRGICAGKLAASGLRRGQTDSLVGARPPPPPTGRAEGWKRVAARGAEPGGRARVREGGGQPSPGGAPVLGRRWWEGEILRGREKAAVREYNGEIRRDIEWWWAPST
jgi:hypothetical protein